MAVRQLLQPIDLRQSLPDPTQINPGQYDEAIRRRFDSIGNRGSYASAISARDANQRMMQAYQSRLNSMQAATPTFNGAGGNIKWDGKKWFDITGGKYGYSGTWGKYAGSGGEHNALDFLTPLGSKIYMPFGGTIVSAGFEPQKSKGAKYFGNAIRIRFDNGTYGIIGHLGSFAKGLKAGQHIDPGVLLALSGNTGYSTGPHTHFEMRTSLYDPSTAFDYRYLFGW